KQALVKGLRSGEVGRPSCPHDGSRLAYRMAAPQSVGAAARDAAGGLPALCDCAAPPLSRFDLLARMARLCERDGVLASRRSGAGGLFLPAPRARQAALPGFDGPLFCGSPARRVPGAGNAGGAVLSLATGTGVF